MVYSFSLERWRNSFCTYCHQPRPLICLLLPKTNHEVGLQAIPFLSAGAVIFGLQPLALGDGAAASLLVRGVA